ncbi:MAG: glycoside hydrolase family 32 protein [Planctomycetota bacterium]|nr:glycoside hydrolase family 32 protein [Planctomycetota bacterium]
MPDYRPLYHVAPPTGWLNDPNGLVCRDGEYHLFYQWCPDVNVDGMRMYWGHAVSRDLARWEHLPVALEPDALGSIWSGCAVDDARNTSGFFGAGGGLVAIFTHHAEFGAERQSLAFSADRGRTWTKHAGNPVLGDDESRNFRDPKVFWHAETSRWIMVVGVDHKLYASENLRDWTFLSAPEFSSECPDLFPLEVEGRGEPKWLLSLGGFRYVAGDFDGVRFSPLSGPHLADHGPDFYATQSWEAAPGGRRIWIGWLNHWRYARAIPEFGARGVMSIPRELALRATTDQGLRLIQRPVRELESLRRETVAPSGAEASSGKRFYSGDAYELEATLVVDDEFDRCGFRLRASKTQETLVGYDGPAGGVFLDRERSGGTVTRGRYGLVGRGKRIPLRVFVDRGSVEAFFDHGLRVFSAQIFPDAGSLDLAWFSESGKCRAEDVKVHRLG